MLPSVVRVVLAAVVLLLVFFLCRLVGLLLLTAGRRLQPRATSSVLTRAPPSSARPLRTLLVLGSGGHTAELLALLSRLPRGPYEPRVFVRAETDQTSETRVRQAEGKHMEEDGLSPEDFPPSTFVAIPRSREVGQSYLSSVRTTLVAIGAAAKVVLDVKPQLVSLTRQPMWKPFGVVAHAPCISLCLSFSATVPARAFRSA
jgi:hypothetical protein